MNEVMRAGLAIEVATSLPSPRVMAGLEPVVATQGAPPCMRSDHGPACIALTMRGWLAQHQLPPLSIAPGGPWQNGDGERFNGTVCDDCLKIHGCRAGAEARVLLDAYRRQYPEARPHRSLGSRPPAAFQRDGLECQA